MGRAPWVITPSEELERGRGDSSSWPLLDSSSVLWLPSDSLWKKAGNGKCHKTKEKKKERVYVSFKCANPCLDKGQLNKPC